MVFAGQPAIMRNLAVHMWKSNGRCVALGLTVLRSGLQRKQSRSDPSDDGLGSVLKASLHGLNERIRVQSLYDGRDFLFSLVKLYAEQVR